MPEVTSTHGFKHRMLIHLLVRPVLPFKSATEHINNICLPQRAEQQQVSLPWVPWLKWFNFLSNELPETVLVSLLLWPPPCDGPRFQGFSSNISAEASFHEVLSHKMRRGVLRQDFCGHQVPSRRQRGQCLCMLYLNHLEEFQAKNRQHGWTWTHPRDCCHTSKDTELSQRTQLDSTESPQWCCSQGAQKWSVTTVM